MSESQAPKQLSLKRRIDEPPPDALILQRKLKKIHGEEFNVHYVRKKRDGEEVEFTLKDQAPPPGAAGPIQQPVQSSQHPPSNTHNRRIYRLDHANNSTPGKRKRGAIEDIFVTSSPQPTPSRQPQQPHEPKNPPTPAFKRPGKSAAINPRRIDSSTSQPPPPSSEESQRVTAIANQLHEVALQEIAQQTRAKSTKKPVPKLSGARSRELHLQRVAGQTTSNNQDVEMTDDGEGFVFDTYELVPRGETTSSTQAEANILGQVGYLILSEADEELWERYLEDEPSDKDWDSDDDDDENAEGHYGADYPEDELASDDEYNRNMYRTGRHGGSDDEAWDEDTGTYSDDEYERTMNPWKAKSPAQFAKCLGHSDTDD